MLKSCNVENKDEFEFWENKHGFEFFFPIEKCGIFFFFNVLHEFSVGQNFSVGQEAFRGGISGIPEQCPAGIF